ncbi:MAG: tetratricopeptide repeat protein, partial [Burkholderiales bacterium]
MKCLERVRDLDSQAEALRTLLRAHLAMKNLAEATPLAGKLVAVHNDLTGVTICADTMIRAGDCEAALRLYAQHADRLLAKNARALVDALNDVIDGIKNNASALDILRSLYEKAGESTHLSEVNELLAHALVQAGDLARARDLYKQLSEVEPDNPVHLQNYNQVRARLGDDATQRPIPADQATEPFMVDELETPELPIETKYPREVLEAVKSAITDSELLDSYNLSKKALAPLEAVLPEAPLHPMLNQRLASLYAREERFSEAARCCDVLRAVYWNAGHTEHALRYADMAVKYRERIGETAPEFSIEAILNPQSRKFPAVEETTETFGTPDEIDISHEWESLLLDAPGRSMSEMPVNMREMPGDSDVEAAVNSLMQERTTPAVVQPPVAEEPAVAVQQEPVMAPPAAVAPTPAAVAVTEGTSRFVSSDDALASHLSAVGDLVEEVRFYISQEMLEEAEAAIERCAVMAPELSDLSELRREIAGMKAAYGASEETVAESEFTPLRGVSSAHAHESVLEVPVAQAGHAGSHAAEPLDELVLDFEESLKTSFVVEAADVPEMAMATASVQTPTRT